MKQYKRWNNILGWIVFIIATVTYFCTLEPTASWWDCGEYISTAAKLQVGHPPGAPTFQLLGRFFSMFAFGNTKHIALMVNAMSALCSSFTILLLFWSITMLTKKIIAPESNFENKDDKGKQLTIFAAGLIGALAYTFSDTFWFSAVEGEVYAMSSLCTAIVFWAILKWDEQNNDKDANRWLIFIAYIMGLSIGVHLLNLLAITAIALVFYYKKHPKATAKGTIFSILISFVLIALILYVIVPLIVKYAGAFELFFVNTLGARFNIGTVVYFTLLIGLITAAWIYSVKKGAVVWNTIIVSFTFLLIGYSTFFLIVIRANTNTPINEGSPSDAISLQSYLNREQYGSRPLLYGQYYTAPMESFKDAPPTYVKDKASGKYIMTDTGKEATPEYNKDFCTIFPRMWSSQKDIHMSAYQSWGKVKGKTVKASHLGREPQTYTCPTFGENLRFFFSYQANHMYIRYFMWNFVGRQNDIESYGGISNGNWKSGIEFIDKARLGSQKDLPASLQSHADNSFYFLPLILGLIGMFYHYKRNSKYGLVVTALFLMTGLAIIIYLNQTPYQPRERDYAYAGSFYAFAMWIGIGVAAVAGWFNKLLKNQRTSAITAFVICLLAVPTLMAVEGWDDHNRHGKYAARDFGANYFAGLVSNSVLITNGDNDTFPLWYAQEVEGVRTDVRTMNFMLAASEWYAPQMMRKVYDSERLPLTLKEKDYYKGIHEVIRFHDLGMKDAIDVKDFIDNLAKGNLDFETTSGEKVTIFPNKTFKLKVNKEKVIASGIVPPELSNQIVDEIVWTINKNYLTKNDLLLLDFLAGFDWDRPLYFTSPSITSGIFNIDKYCYLDGIAYKLVPIAAKENFIKGIGGVDTKHSYDILVNNNKWGNLNDPKVIVDRESNRNVDIIRKSFYRVAESLYIEGHNDSAAVIVDKCMDYFPSDKIPLDYLYRRYIDIYFAAGQTDKAMGIAKILHDRYYYETAYYLSQQPHIMNYYIEDIKTNFSYLQDLVKKCEQYGFKEYTEQYSKEFTTLVESLELKSQN